MNDFEKYYEMSEQTGWRINDLNWKKIDIQNIQVRKVNKDFLRQ